MEARNPNWKKQMKYLKFFGLENNQLKPYKSDGMNNYANNTKPALGGTPYTELI